MELSKEGLPAARREEQILKFWKEIDAFKKSVSRRPKNRQFVFYEGPPTANGRPGIHHVLTRAFKDIICRYKTMKGYRVERKAGWDTHGLPVEIEIEKQLGLKNKKDIDKYGIAKFNEKCRESVWKYKTEWDNLTERIGFWIDLENPYITYDPLYMEALWGIIKKAYEKNLLYEGHRVAPYCPRCGTSVSSHEVALGYKDITEDSVFVKFSIFNFQFSNTYLLAWTTTPWTLPGNVALAVGAKINYVLVKQGEEHYILAKERLNILEGEYEIIKEFVGKELEGLEYEPVFEIFNFQFSIFKNLHHVVLADFVTTQEGTGIVHTAVMYGEDDYNLGQKLDLPRVHTVDEAGKFNNLVPKWQGEFVKDAESKIIEDLKARNILYKKEKYAHPYPFCWRCGTPLLYYAMLSWFIKMSALRDNLIKNNGAINWVPDYIKEGRFGEWLRDVKDWNFSRLRYWGTPLPIWKCKDCKSVKVVGSIKELGKQIPKNRKKEIDLHRPYVDKITFKCACKGTMKREEALVDVWFDSGSMPLASQVQNHADINAELRGKILFPADYICEGIDQTRGWFYTLLAVSAILGFKSPYKNVISLAHVLDKKGEKMSKSKGNVVDPWEMINKYSSDALRWYFYTVNQPGDYKRFDESDLQKTQRKFISTLYNALAFYRTYRTYRTNRTNNVLDRWILSRLNNLIADIVKRLDNYDVTGAARGIESFVIDDLSNWYIRRSRKRFPEQVIAHVLLETSKLCAPFVPFLSEHIFQDLKAKSYKALPTGRQVKAGSVHWQDFPKDNKKYIDLDLEKEMSLARKIVEIVHGERARAGIRVRQPLGALEIDADLPDEINKIIADEVNVKEVKRGVKIALDTKLTPRLKEEGFINEFMRHVQDLRKSSGFVPKDKIMLRYFVGSDLSKSIYKRKNAIIKQSNASDIIEAKGKKEVFKAQAEFEWEGERVWIGIRKIKNKK